MDKKSWKKKIKAAMVENDTYKAPFDIAIDTLAGILENRDAALADYIADGSRPTILKTSDRGAVNVAKNPKLLVLQDANTQALAYLRDLGLTAAGLKRITDAIVKPSEPSLLEQALERLSNEVKVDEERCRK